MVVAASGAYGWVGAAKAHSQCEQGWPILAGALVLAVLSERFSRSFKDQATNFARSVYLAFAASGGKSGTVAGDGEPSSKAT